MFLNREEGALVSSQDTESTEYFWGEILHSLLNLVLLKKKDFQVINQNIIKTSIENKICHHGGQRFDAEKIIDLTFKNQKALLDIFLYNQRLLFSSNQTGKSLFLEENQTSLV